MTIKHTLYHVLGKLEPLSEMESLAFTAVLEFLCHACVLPALEHSTLEGADVQQAAAKLTLICKACDITQDILLPLFLV